MFGHGTKKISEGIEGLKILHSHRDELSPELFTPNGETTPECKVALVKFICEGRGELPVSENGVSINFDAFLRDIRSIVAELDRSKTLPDSFNGTARKLHNALKITEALHKNPEGRVVSFVNEDTVQAVSHYVTHALRDHPMDEIVRKIRADIPSVCYGAPARLA